MESYNNYESSGGIITGLFNDITNGSSVIGGIRNTANGEFSIISGGYGSKW